jgi:lipoprotein-anchoring transpeptidase ErfK/SrfK
MSGIPIAFIALRNEIVEVDIISVGQVIYLPDPSDFPPEIANKEKIIVVILSTQKLYAYEAGLPIGEFLVSTGLPNTPTVLGKYSIESKLDETTMSGPGYNLPHVKWTMYFYLGYGIHGAYWHNNFGQPMSHGCVNMREVDAEWLYSWAPLGTTVIVLP